MLGQTVYLSEGYRLSCRKDKTHLTNNTSSGKMVFGKPGKMGGQEMSVFGTGSHFKLKEQLEKRLCWAGKSKGR